MEREKEIESTDWINQYYIILQAIHFEFLRLIFAFLLEILRFNYKP